MTPAARATYGDAKEPTSLDREPGSDVDAVAALVVAARVEQRCPVGVYPGMPAPPAQACGNSCYHGLG